MGYDMSHEKGRTVENGAKTDEREPCQMRQVRTEDTDSENLT